MNSVSTVFKYQPSFWFSEEINQLLLHCCVTALIVTKETLLKKQSPEHAQVIFDCSALLGICTGCFTIVETKRQLLKPLSTTLFIFFFPDCHREIVNLSIY